jgi:hypothetical protein
MLVKCPNCGDFVQTPANVEPSALVRCPICSEEYPLSAAIALAPPELVPVNVSDNRPDLPPTSLEQVGQSEETAEQGTTFEAGEVNGEAVRAAEQFASRKILRPRRQKSALGTLIGLALSGFLAALTSYYVLAIWFGPKFSEKMNLPILPLPFISQLTSPKDPPAAPANAIDVPTANKSGRK